MGGTEVGGPLELLVVAVDGDDRDGTCQARTHDRGVADTAAADDGDGLAAGDPAGVHGGTETGHDTAAEQADDGRIGARVDLGALAGVDEGLVGERADAQRRSEFGAVLECHLLGGVEGVEAVLRLTALACATLAAHRAPVQDDEVAHGDRVDALTDGFDDTGGLVAEQERELVVDAALAVGEVGVAHAARGDRDDDLTGAGIGDHDGHDLDRRSLRASDDSADCLRHAVSVS